MFPLANFTNPSDIIPYMATVTGGLGWDLILVGIWIVSFGILGGFTTTERSFATTSFFTGILSITLWAAHGIDAYSSILWVAVAIVGFILLLFSRD
jgi:hypothetical protein